MQSPDRWLWTGQGVTGAEHQGIVPHHSWHGQSYSIDARDGAAKDVSVYLDPADRSQAMIDNVPDRVVAGLLIAGPVVAALVLLVLGGDSQLPVVPARKSDWSASQGVSLLAAMW